MISTTGGVGWLKDATGTAAPSMIFFFTERRWTAVTRVTEENLHGAPDRHGFDRISDWQKVVNACALGFYMVQTAGKE